MTAPNNTVDQLKRDEGTVYYAYQDSKGYWTIGTGILIDKRKNGGLLPEENEFILNNRIRLKREELIKRIPWVTGLDPIRFAVFLNMSFQMGVDGLLGFKKALLLASVGKYAMAAIEMLDSKWAKIDSPSRAERLAKQMETGVWQ